MKTTTQLQMQHWDLGDVVVKGRILDAIADGQARYPIHRSLHFAAREELEGLVDRYAMLEGWRVNRPSVAHALMETEGVFATLRGGRKSDYCSCSFNIWAATPELADSVRERLAAVVEATRIRDAMFSIDWHFLTAKGELESVEIEELADDVLLDCAYPEIDGGVSAFIARYLASSETVLVVQGPPGTGKTRLIRAILGAIAHRDGASRALYTGDTKSIESDEIFVKFITGWDNAFVIEDADHLLKPRSAGNEHLHRFLAIADGVVRAQGRKIIFSTNLPNVRDLDDALTRPGRCFARLNCRELTSAEAGRVIDALCADSDAAASRAREALTAQADRRSHALAAVYAMVAAAREEAG